MRALADPDAVARVAADLETSLSARLAFGIRNAPRRGKTSWVVIEIDEGSAWSDGTSVLDSLENAEAELEVVLGIAATEDVWVEAADEDVFLEAVRDQKFFVSGEAPFFIRNLEKILAIWMALAKE